MYVRLVPREEFNVKMSAASYFHRSSTDDDVSLSRYGEHSVAVDVCITSTSLIQLCHELGHISYIIPNLAQYREFYLSQYNSTNGATTPLGHHHHDISGRWASAFERRFSKSNRQYIETIGGKLRGTYTVLKRIRVSLGEETKSTEQVASLGGW